MPNTCSKYNISFWCVVKQKHKFRNFLYFILVFLFQYLDSTTMEKYKKWLIQCFEYERLMISFSAKESKWMDYFSITGCDDNTELCLSGVFTQGTLETNLLSNHCAAFSDAWGQTDDFSCQEERCWHVCLCGHKYGWREGQRSCGAGGVWWVPDIYK